MQCHPKPAARCAFCVLEENIGEGKCSKDNNICMLETTTGKKLAVALKETGDVIEDSTKLDAGWMMVGCWLDAAAAS